MGATFFLLLLFLKKGRQKESEKLLAIVEQQHILSPVPHALVHGDKGLNKFLE